MAQAVRIEDQVSIMSSPKKTYNFFKNDLPNVKRVVPHVFNKAKVVDGKVGQPGGTVEYELFIFGDKVTVKLTIEKIDDAQRSITFAVVREHNEKNMALMLKLTVNNGSITWSLQFADAEEVSEDVTRVAKAVIDLIIKALDIYLLF